MRVRHKLRRVRIVATIRVGLRVEFQEVVEFWDGFFLVVVGDDLAGGSGKGPSFLPTFVEFAIGLVDCLDRVARDLIHCLEGGVG
jgi:hypothetical protein